MANKWIDYVYKETDYRGGELSVAQKLADAANRDTDECTLKIQTIAGAVRLSVRQVKRILHHLEADGFLEIRRFQGRGKEPIFKLKKVTSASPFKARQKVTSDAQKGDICDTEKVTFVTFPNNRINPLEEPIINPEEETPYGYDSRDDRLMAYHEVYKHNIPSVVQQDLILHRVTDLAVWREVVMFWASNNYRAQSIGRMLDKYDEAIKEKQNGTDKKPTSERERSAKRVIDGERLADEIAAGLHDDAVSKLFSRGDKNNSPNRLIG